MKNIIKYRFIVLVLILGLSFSGISFAAIELDQGDDLGDAWGTFYGYDDYLDNEDSDWFDAYRKAFDDDDELFEYFDIENEDEDDLDDFEDDFKDEFEKEYKKAYDDIEDWDENRDFSDYLAQAENIGKAYGEYDSYNDFFDNRSSDWEDAFEDRFRDDEDLFDYFNIEREDDNDLDDFYKDFKEGYEEQYDDSYDDIEEASENHKVEYSSDDAEKETEETAKKDAETLAELDGREAGIIDYLNNQENDWDDSYPSESTIEKKYNLDNETRDYKKEFLEAYEIEYQIAYEKAFREANLDRIGLEKNNAFEHGKSLGTKQGESFGYLDLIQGKFSNWKYAYDSFRNTESIRDRYYLYKFDKDYGVSFEKGFEQGFEIGYHEMFQDTNIKIEEKNLNYVMLTSDAMRLDYSEHRLGFNGGSSSTNAKTPIYMDFEEGTIYEHDVYLGMNATQASMMDYSRNYGSSIYDIVLKSEQDYVDFQKPVKLAFSFSGGSQVGIYKYEKGQWHYLPTEYDEGEIYTMIPEGDYDGGRYTVVVNYDLKPIKINRMHWAFPDIKLFSYRHIINGNAFNPDGLIKRKDFSRLIYKSFYGSKYFDFRPTMEYTDLELAPEYLNEIYFMINNGYMIGNGNGEYKPDEYITYNQAVTVMNRILKSDYSLDELRTDLMRERFTKLKSNQWGSNNITQGEILFMISDNLGSDALLEQVY
jgi:hypothetical protein